MKFSVTAGALRDSLSQVRHVIPGTPSLVAYSGVLIVAGDGRVRLLGSDGETSLSSVLDVQTELDGQALLQPKPLGTYLATLDASCELTVSTDEQGDIEVAPRGMAAYKFRPLAATYPQPPQIPGDPRPVNLDRLGSALSSIRAAVSRDSLAVQVVSGDDGLVLHSTDTFRLARAALPEAGFGEFTGVLPLPVLERVARIGATSVVVDARSRMVAFQAPTMTTSSRLLAVPFPAVETVVASVPPGGVTFNPRELRVALARLAAVADQAAVRIRLAGTEMTLSVSTAEIGTGEETVPLFTSPPAPFDVLAKAQYLQDAVSALDCDQATMSYSGPLQPLFLTTSEPFELLHVVMPVRA